LSLLPRDHQDTGFSYRIKCKNVHLFPSFRSYPSWLFKESDSAIAIPTTSSVMMNTSLSEPDLRTVGCTGGVEDSAEDAQDDAESEDEGWYSLSRTGLRKIRSTEAVKSAGGGHVNLVLTNCGGGKGEEEEEESSQDRNSYRYDSLIVNALPKQSVFC
jgi:hypothetical protein